MLRVPWEMEEAVALFDFYFQHGQTNSIPKKELETLSAMLNKRAKALGLTVDHKFRNVNGLSLQLNAVHSIVRGDPDGFGRPSKVFLDTYDLFKNEPDLFRRCCQDFHEKYCIE